MEDTEKMSDEEFNNLMEKEARKQFEKVRMAGLLSGSKAICGVVMQYINEFNMASGKKSNNDYKRLIKKISNFCSVSLGKKVDETNGEIVDVEQNNNTKLSEDVEELV